MIFSVLIVAAAPSAAPRLVRGTAYGFIVVTHVRVTSGRRFAVLGIMMRVCVGRRMIVVLSTIEFLYEVRTANASELMLDISAFLGFIPEEELPLGELLLRSFGREYGLESIRVVTRIPGLGRNGHRRWREVLHLLKMEVEVLCYHR